MSYELKSAVSSLSTAASSRLVKAGNQFAASLGGTSDVNRNLHLKEWYIGTLAK